MSKQDVQDLQQKYRPTTSKIQQYISLYTWGTFYPCVHQTHLECLCQGSVVCVICSCLCVHVSIFGLFPVLVRCDYWLILVQPCLSNYLWFTCVFIVLSVQFDFVWSTHYSRCFLSALSALKTIIWVYVLVCVSLFLPAVCTVTVCC